MARLRIRIELNRGGVGVPLHKLASVVAEAQKFFRMLGDDIQIDHTKGEWLGFDFDHESLNFTAEFVGPVTAEQVSAFNAAFDGTTSLRRATIAQFAHITDAIGEDELIGFGLYLNEAGTEPGEWRCLSRRDALRIAEEIHLLIGAGEEVSPVSHLPAVSDSSIGARLFSERRERGLEPAKFAGMVRDVEANLSKRIGKLETEVGDHAVRIDDLRAKSASSEASIGRLVSAVEGFLRTGHATVGDAAIAGSACGFAGSAVACRSRARERFALAVDTVISVALVVALLALSLLLWPGRGDQVQKMVAAAPAEQVPVKQEVSASVVEPVVTAPVKSAPVKPPAPFHALRNLAWRRLILIWKPSEPTWIFDH
jgi:hypothetical protein